MMGRPGRQQSAGEGEWQGKHGVLKLNHFEHRFDSVLAHFQFSQVCARRWNPALAAANSLLLPSLPRAFQPSDTFYLAGVQFVREPGKHIASRYRQSFLVDDRKREPRA